jgi:hypothetical protein
MEIVILRHDRPPWFCWCGSQRNPAQSTQWCRPNPQNSAILHANGTASEGMVPKDPKNDVQTIGYGDAVP